MYIRPVKVINEILSPITWIYKVWFGSILHIYAVLFCSAVWLKLKHNFTAESTVCWPFIGDLIFLNHCNTISSLYRDLYVVFLNNSTFKKKAPKAIKEIRKFAQKAMGTKDVRVDVKLNKHIWSRGIRSVPRRIRVRIARKRNDDEDAKEELYSLVTVAEIPAEGLKGLETKIIEEDDWFITSFFSRTKTILENFGKHWVSWDFIISTFRLLGQCLFRTPTLVCLLILATPFMF